ncbi:thermonuclease family protein [Arsenicitalea aurantiaca]|uniref:Thermonuclease family protein n=1 Tax=Arsenicitalea aurantiaca TaxID=1783274 RepID=A0A433X2H6_9HYPH|nr:thermonuclease family protein [Arsenicitalea aurantiaca]RUT28237.1 thermonuclease family protein [Arsenicitalea aurantiaca]
METCIVDGDTLWVDGEMIRLKGSDTPEPQTSIFGGRAEVELAHRASDRLMESLNTYNWTIERPGYDNPSRRRTLARFHIGNTTASQMLIDKGLAPDLAGW